MHAVFALDASGGRSLPLAGEWSRDEVAEFQIPSCRGYRRANRLGAGPHGSKVVIYDIRNFRCDALLALQPSLSDVLVGR